MKCIDCPKFVKDRGCILTPSEMDDPICILKHIAWMVTILAEDSEDSDGEEWKLGTNDPA